LGGDQPLRYVRHEDLEPCPEHGRRISVNVDPNHWSLSAAGDRSVPSDVIGFQARRGRRRGRGAAAEVCLARAAEAINRWQHESRAAPSALSDGEDGVPLSVRKLLGLLQILDNSRDAGAVQEAIKEARKAHPRTELRLRPEIGLGELAAGDAEGAVRTYVSIADEDPISYPEVHSRLATCRFVAGRLDEAAACARRALALDPSHAPAWSGPLREARLPAGDGVLPGEHLHRPLVPRRQQALGVRRHGQSGGEPSRTRSAGQRIRLLTVKITDCLVAMIAHMYVPPVVISQLELASFLASRQLCSAMFTTNTSVLAISNHVAYNYNRL
jgi:tetratricopeptide (TPR) repeat protein